MNNFKRKYAKILEKADEMLYNIGELFFYQGKMNFLNLKYAKIKICHRNFRGKYEKIF